ncbi:LAQU0S01e16270g1_1 [Lachancea quebecensis]|uniref:LAQU0S01e16270g1_1 n=1 Tax=Lachancea quebecensis TaxID=1654605 RepID=A0A0P1KXQ5_9SACH|nr:LAQU0S01e16270g1_1 [Lachancea quebecensis]
MANGNQATRALTIKMSLFDTHYRETLSVTQRYTLASRARSKMMRCASQGKSQDLNLRVLVGHANLLDRVMESLHSEEDEEVNTSDEDEPIELGITSASGPGHVTFALPQPLETVYEYDSDSDSDNDGASSEYDTESDDDFSSESDSESEDESDDENFPGFGKSKNYTLTGSDAATASQPRKHGGGNLYLFSLTDDDTGTTATGRDLAACNGETAEPGILCV